MIVKNFKKFLIIPAVVLVAALVVGIICGGLNLGLDFTGGSQITIDMGETFDSEKVRVIVEGVEGVTGDVSVITSGADGTEALIRVQNDDEHAMDETLATAIYDAVAAEFSNTSDNITVDSVGATASGTLITNAILAVVIACVLMLIYITIRFQLYSAIGAVVALIHDVLIMIMVMCIFRVSVDSTFIAACLTIVGYSINATVIIFDRIRDNTKKYGSSKTEAELVDMSVKESMGRTINTTVTTLIMILMLFILGVESIRIFAFPIIIGIFAGTFSSMIIAPSIWALLSKKFGRKVKGVKAIR